MRSRVLLDRDCRVRANVTSVVAERDPLGVEDPPRLLRAVLVKLYGESSGSKVHESKYSSA